jgi:hypothetical protein
MLSPANTTTKKPQNEVALLEWKKKRKEEENKCQVETQMKEWINRTMTIDHLLLSDNMTKVTEIDLQPVNNYNMVYPL